MSIDKLAEFAESGEKHLNNLDIKQGFQQAEKPERQWFNYLLNDFSKKINQVIDGLSDIDFEFNGFAPKISELESNYTEISSELTRVSDDFKSADAVLQGQIDGIGGGKFAYTTYAKMEAAAALPDEDPLKLPANSSIDVTNDTDPLKNGTYSYDGAVFAKSIYDVETIVRTKVLNTFKTKALMDASALPDGTDAQVTDDTVNHGLYVKTAGAWVKSTYDPILRANQYTDEKTKNVTNKNSFGELLSFSDVENNTYAYFDNYGGLQLSGMDNTVQDTMSVLENTVSSEKDGASAFNFEDAEGEIIASISKNSVLVVNDVSLKDGHLSDIIKRLNNESNAIKASARNAAAELVDRNRASYQNSSNTSSVLADAIEHGPARSLFGPSIVRTGENSFFLAYDVRKTGDDYDDIYVAGRVVTYDKDTGLLTAGTPLTLATSSVVEGGIYTYLNPNVTYVSEGINSGRILVHFNGMFVSDPYDAGKLTYAPIYVYSDDNGATFSDPIDLSPLFDMESLGGRLNFGPGHTTQITEGKYAGRIVLPSYYKHIRDDGSYYHSAVAVITDDGGDTYYLGSRVTNPTNLNEWQIVNGVGDSLVGIIRRGSGIAEKYITRSYDGGLTFSRAEQVDGILGAGTKIGLDQSENYFDFSTPKLLATCARNPDAAPDVRVDPHIWVSYDDGETFPIRKKIASGVCQYTDVIQLNEDEVLVIYGGGTHPIGNQVKANIVNLKFLLEK